jgi:hypothetical protein
MASNVTPMEHTQELDRRDALLARIASLRGVRNSSLKEVDGGIATTILVIPEANETRLRPAVKSAAKDLGLALEDDSIVFLSSGSPGRSGGRRNLTRVNTDHFGGNFVASVSLELGGDILAGEHRSNDACSLRLSAVAQATLNACRDLLSESAEVEDICLLVDGERSSVLVSILLGITPLLGAATVRFDEYDATARAVLDAVNRAAGRDRSTSSEGLMDIPGDKT